MSNKENLVYTVKQVIPVLHFDFNLYIPIGTVFLWADDGWYTDVSRNYWIKKKYIDENPEMFEDAQYNKYATLPDEVLKMFKYSFSEVKTYDELTREEKKIFDKHDFESIKKII